MNEIDKIIPGQTKLTFLGDDFHNESFNEHEEYEVMSDNSLSFLLIDNKGHEAWFFKESILKYFQLPKEEIKPVYWKENDFISPGDKLLVKGKSYSDDHYRQSKILFIGKEVFVYLQIETESHECYGVIAEHDFKEIDTRTDKERSIDDLDNFLLIDGHVGIEESYRIAEGIFNLISDGDVTGTKFTESK